MVFKKVCMHGFKSFADKLEVDFSGGVTCIVGPNGCGKSNVSDAIRWVLGEQSSKALRGTNMSDVIFKGTQTRRPLSYCEVSLHFDNTDKIFPVDYSDLVLGRKLYRSGESEYFINNGQSRLKDITNLLHDSGIDRDGLTIISQGQIAEIINSKPENRRDIFEEAAGIAKFRKRKKEAESKMAKVDLDLQRVRDVITEIQRNLGPLLKQAENAEKYIVLRDQLKLLEINLYIHQYDTAAVTKQTLTTQIEELQANLAAKQDEIAKAAAKAGSALDELGNIDTYAEKIREQVLQLSLGLEQHKGERKLVQERMSMLTNQELSQATDLTQMERRLELERETHAENKRLMASLDTDKQSLYKDLSEAGETYKTVTDTEGQRNRLVLERTSLEERKKTIQSLIDSGEGYRFTVRKIIQSKSRNRTVESNIVGVVAQELTVPTELETAIEVALGAAAQNIITKNEDNAKAMIDLLAREKWGRATFLPITSVRAKTLSPSEKQTLNRTKGVVGVASELVEFDKFIAPVVDTLLGRTVVVDDIDTAIALARAHTYAFKIVTLDGDVIETRGSITGGSKNALNNNLWHTNNLAAIDEELAQIDTRLAKLDDGATTVTAAETMTQIRVKIAALESESAALAATVQNQVNTILLLEKSVGDKRAQLKDITKDMSVAKELEASEEEQRLYAESMKRLDYARGELANFDAKKESLRNLIAELDEKRAAASSDATELQGEYYRTQGALERVDTDIQMMQERIAEEYEMNYSSCYHLRDESFDPESAVPQISDLKKQIARLGPVNLHAIEDSRDAKSRHDDYSTQVADLESAKADLEKVIDDLSREMEGKFKTDFDKINHNFCFVFKELFGGGSAKLVLTDPNDYLNSGIEIIAEPPGKKLQNLTLLSGGEKALTAIAILFAILKLRPMPFCLLDEIEAALDDSNVCRFASYLQKFAQTTQFIVITHRKPTMELADNLYGVTMEEQGVSKLVSVKLENAHTA